MVDAPATALKALREALKSPIPDVDTLVECLRICLGDIGLDQGDESRINDIVDTEQVSRAIQRYLPSIQIQLLSEIYPAFYHALDQFQLALLGQLFVPERTSNPKELGISRSIALTSYLVIPPFLNASHTPGLPEPSRSFVLFILNRLRRGYNIDKMYWAVWASNDVDEGKGKGKGKGKSKTGPQELMWEEVVKSLASVPAKCANATGSWKTEGWTGDLPGHLEARPFFDHMIVKLEELMYELSTTTVSGDETERIRTVIQRLASLGLLSPTTSQSSRQPSLVPPLLSGLLSHLNPPHDSPLPPYPAQYLPSIFLPLPASTLSNLVENLLRNLAARLMPQDLDPEKPSEMVHRLVGVLKGIIGPAVLDEEAWVAVLRCTSGRTNFGAPLGEDEHLRDRVVAGWVRTGGEAACKAFLDHVIGLWTNPSSIKFSMYTQQFHLTHLLLLSLSLLRPYHPYLIATSHRAEFLLAVQSFLSHPDPKIRRLGMLVAETLSSLTIKEDPTTTQVDRDGDEIEELKAGLAAEEGGPRAGKGQAKGIRRLKFDSGMWDGEGEGKEECRWLRGCVGTDDLTAELKEDPTGQVWLFGRTPAQITNVNEEALPPTNNGHESTRGRTQQSKSKSNTKARAKPKSQPQPKIVLLDSDQEMDPLKSYVPDSPSSSRSPSPTPSYLEEVAQDPTLSLDTSQKKKLTRPVYVPQLVALLKEREKPDHIEMGLKWGEGLVRAKRSFGTELSENAAHVALVTLALSDPYHLDNFDEQRQGLLNALVACAPKQVAPFLSEQYFNGQYSLQQKSVLLTSLAMGARELAGLSIPQTPNTRRIDFPSKTLPSALHQKYIGPNDLQPNGNGNLTGQLEDAITGVRDMMLSKGAKRGEETVPELAREKRLRVGSTTRTTKIAELGTAKDRQMSQSTRSNSEIATQTQTQIPVIPFKDVAAEFFIMPLINRFWQHYQDSTIRENRALATGDRYRGAGTGMILSALALEKMLMTLSLLVHAARHSSLFLSVLAAEALELGVTIGTRHLATPTNDPFLSPASGGATSGGKKEQGSETEAQVLAAALELVLVSLDTSVELDKGRTLAMDKPELVLAVGEWATGVFEVENKGGEVSSGQGGMREGRVRATAAGVVVKIAEIGERWLTVGRMMR